MIYCQNRFKIRTRTRCVIFYSKKCVEPRNEVLSSLKNWFLRCWTNIAQMLYKCFVFAGIRIPKIKHHLFSSLRTQTKWGDRKQHDYPKNATKQWENPLEANGHEKKQSPIWRFGKPRKRPLWSQRKPCMRENAQTSAGCWLRNVSVIEETSIQCWVSNVFLTCLREYVLLDVLIAETVRKQWIKPILIIMINA